VSWVRIDDGFSEHPKATAVGLAGQGLYVAGLCYCNRQLTDGDIPLTSLVVVSGLALRPARALADRLVGAGLWERSAAGYRVHDYLGYQESRAKVLKKRAADLARKGRGFRTDSLTIPLGIPEDSDGIPETFRADSDGSHPIPSDPEIGSAIADPPNKRLRRRDLTEADLAEFRDRFPTLDVGREAERYENWCQAKGQPHKDKVAGLRNWLMGGEDREKTRRAARPGARNGTSPADRAEARLRGV